MKYTFALFAFSVTLLLAACSESEEQNNTKTTESTKSNQKPKENNAVTMNSNDSSNDSDGSVDGTSSTNQKTANSKKGSADSTLDSKDESGMKDDSSDEGNSSKQENTSQSTSNNSDPTSTKDEAPAFNIHEYKKLNSFLGKYVSNGHVNYASIKSNKSELMAIINEFESTSPSSSWSKNEKLCFWINAYNIFTIKLIVDNYPTSSITKITAKPWDKKFIEIGGSTYSLNGIETDIIRKKYDEPRIHFALNCASKSCPILLNKAYKPATLNSQLTSQTKAFLNDTSKNDFSSKKSVEISSIFDWYKDDFSSSGGVIAFINKYKGTDYDSPKISYMDYSWDLNK